MSASLDLTKYEGHTPGPWSYDGGVLPPDGPERYSTVTAMDGDTVIAETNDLIAEGAVNALLITDAPQLLAALLTMQRERDELNKLWRTMESAPTDGTLCQLRFAGFGGAHDFEEDYFLHDDGHWYRVDPPMQMAVKPIAWRPAQ